MNESLVEGGREEGKQLPDAQCSQRPQPEETLGGTAGRWTSGVCLSSLTRAQLQR